MAQARDPGGHRPAGSRGRHSGGPGAGDGARGVAEEDRPLRAYTVAPLAQHEIVEAAFYVYRKTSDFSAADTLLEQIYKSFGLIASMPRLGRPRTEFGRGLRSHEVGNYTVFYRPHRRYVEITRVLHQRRDVRRAFAKPRRGKIELTPEFEQAVWDRVDTGQYASTADVLNACIEALAEREAHLLAREAPRREIQVGLDQIERGEVVDGEEAFARIHKRLRERAAERAKQAEEDGNEPAA